MLRALLLVAMAYRTTNRDALLRHPLRKAIYEGVKADPGVSLSDLKSRLRCSWGTLHHHVRLMERNQYIQSEAMGRTRHLFANYADSNNRREMALLRRGRVLDLVETVLREPGANQSHLTQSMGMSRKVLRCYMDELVDHGLVQETRDAYGLRYHPTEALEGVLRDVAPLLRA